MHFETYISKRYLISKHKINFITIISLISIIGIAVGVAALIVVLSVFNGFGSLVQSYLMNMDPDLRIEVISNQGFAKEKEIIPILKSQRNIKYYAPFVSGKVLSYSGGNTQVVNLKGVDESQGDNIYGLKRFLVLGTYDLSDIGGLPHIAIGLTLSDRLGTVVGDTITIISPTGIEQSISQFSMPETQRFVISGIYSSNNNDYDASFIFCDLNYGQRLLGYGINYQGYDIKLDNQDNSVNVKNMLESKLGSNLYSINTWYDFHKELYTVMQVERWTAYILLCLIIVVASFNTLGTLSMSVIEKKRDIGILRSMGASENSILKIFMYEGLLIGIIGTITGLVLGYFVCYLQIHYNIYPLDPSRYKIDSLPVSLRLSDFFFVSGASMLLSIIASLIPAKQSTKVNPLEAIKWE